MPQKERDRINLGKANYLLLLIAAILLIAGYFIMSLNEISISPITLLIAYVVIIPLALLKRSKPKE
jgi:membrane protein YdbS with pleckstrin-like domain